MGLKIKSTEQNSIKIVGTEIVLNDIYGRLEFAGRADGKRLEIAIMTFASKEAYKMGAGSITTDVQQGNLNIDILPTEIQSTEVAHTYAVSAYQQLGYDVEII